MAGVDMEYIRVLQSRRKVMSDLCGLKVLTGGFTNGRWNIQVTVEKQVISMEEKYDPSGFAHKSASEAFTQSMGEILESEQPFIEFRSMQCCSAVALDMEK